MDGIIGIVKLQEEPTESFELDFNKVKTVEDCVLLLKCFICGFNKGYEPTITIYNTNYLYDQMKHLAKGENNAETTE